MSEKSYVKVFLGLQVYWNDRRHDAMFPSQEEFQSMVDTFVKSFLGHDGKENYENGLFVEAVLYQHQNERNSMEKHKQFWLLMQDHEFLTAYLFQDYNFFPQIYGICGSLYGIEYAKPLSNNALLPFTFSWKERLTRAKDIVKYIELIEHGWIEPLHLCDVKHDHFGWRGDGKVVYLDLDAVLTESSLAKIMINTPNCQSNEDCTFFDCAGYCELSTNTCLSERMNTNLQVVCNKIFTGHSESAFVRLAGLLVSPERDAFLSDAIDLCSTNKGMTAEAMIEALEKAILIYESKTTL